MTAIPQAALDAGRAAFIKHTGMDPRNFSEESLQAVDAAIGAAVPLLAHVPHEAYCDCPEPQGGP